MASRDEAPRRASGALASKASEVCELAGVVQALSLPPRSDVCLQAAVRRLVEESQSIREAAKAEEQERESLEREVQQLRDALRPAGPPALQWKGSQCDNVRRLDECLLEFQKEVDSLPKCLREADARSEREAVLKITAPLLNPGESSLAEAEAELEGLRRDLTDKKPLQSLLELGTLRLREGRDSSSRLGKVANALGGDIRSLVEQFDGDKPVPFVKEDGRMRSFIQRYFRDVITQLDEEDGAALVLSTRLDSREDALRGEILELSSELSSKDVMRDRGLKEQMRIDKMKDLVLYYFERLHTTQRPPNGLLEAKQEELQHEVREDSEAFQSLQLYHTNRAAAIRLQLQHLADFVLEKESDSRQEEAKEQVKNEVQSLRDGLHAWLERARALSSRCCALDRKQLAYEEAERVRQAALPRLEEAERTHLLARARVARAEELLTGLSTCLTRAYLGLREKVEQDMQECRQKAPLYGVRCLVVKEQLHAAMQAKRQTLRRLQGRSLAELQELDNKMLMLEHTNGKGLEAAEEKYNQCQARLGKLEEQLTALQEMELSISHSGTLGIATESVTAAEPGMQSGAQQWLQEFFFTHRRRGSSTLPTLTEGEVLSARSRRELQAPICQESAMWDGETTVVGSEYSIVDVYDISPH